MSKNWLTSWSQDKAPAAESKVAPAGSDDFARKVQALRQATGRAETRRMRFVCAQHGGHSAAVFERLNPNDKFRLARVEKTPLAAGAAAGGGASTAQVMSFEDFDGVAFACACCGDFRGFVWCEDCQSHVCKGRTTEHIKGVEYFRCSDACGTAGILEPYDKIHAEANAPGMSMKRRPLPSAPLLAARPAFLALPPGGAAPRLGGPGR